MTKRLVKILKKVKDLFAKWRLLIKIYSVVDKLKRIRKMKRAKTNSKLISREQVFLNSDGTFQPVPVFFWGEPMKYEKCPHCGKKGWRRYQTRNYIGMECRYCRKSITTHQRLHTTQNTDKCPKCGEEGMTVRGETKVYPHYCLR